MLLLHVTPYSFCPITTPDGSCSADYPDGSYSADYHRPTRWFAKQFADKLDADKVLVQKSGYFARAAPARAAGTPFFLWRGLELC